jgi:hypothetical protein
MRSKMLLRIEPTPKYGVNWRRKLFGAWTRGADSQLASHLGQHYSLDSSSVLNLTEAEQSENDTLPAVLGNNRMPTDDLLHQYFRSLNCDDNILLQPLNINDQSILKDAILGEGRRLLRLEVKTNSRQEGNLDDLNELTRGRMPNVINPNAAEEHELATVIYYGKMYAHDAPFVVTRPNPDLLTIRVIQENPSKLLLATNELIYKLDTNACPKFVFSIKDTLVVYERFREWDIFKGLPILNPFIKSIKLDFSNSVVAIFCLVMGIGVMQLKGDAFGRIATGFLVTSFVNSFQLIQTFIRLVRHKIVYWEPASAPPRRPS